MSEKLLTLKVVLLGLLVALGVATIIYGFMSTDKMVIGSVIPSGEYNATTTFAGHTKNERLLKTGASTLGSVIVTGDNTGFIRLYNATTSNVSKRTGNTATSSILFVDFPASSPEGTYTFDITVPTGLLLITSGAEATTTISYR